MNIFSNVYLKRQNTKIMEARFPKKCFISYSDKDTDAGNLLKKKLQHRGVQSFNFPPIKVPPHKFNSNELIEAILGHQEHIYVKDGHSNLSFWVNFSRDYALRAHKQVSSFDPVTMKIEKCRLPPMKLPIFPCYLANESKKLQELFTYMQNRHLSLHSWLNTNGITAETIRETVDTVIRNGGFCTLLLTSTTLKSKIVKHEIKHMLETYPDRILIGLVDKISTRDIPGFSDRNHVVQLFGDSKRPEKQRWDDLIVNLYWLIYHPSYTL